MADDQQRIAWGLALRTNLGALEELHGIVAERIERQKALDEALEEALQRVGSERLDEAGALAALSRASDDAARRARLIAVRLEAALLEGKIDDEAFKAANSAAFPRGGQAIGNTPAQRFEALDRIASVLADHPAADPGGELAKLATEGAQAIRDANDSAKREQTEHKDANEQLTKARHAWDEGYLATKEIVTGLLRDAGRLVEQRQAFPDL